MGQCEEQRQGCNSSVTCILFLCKNTHNLLASCQQVENNLLATPGVNCYHTSSIYLVLINRLHSSTISFLWVHFVHEILVAPCFQLTFLTSRVGMPILLLVKNKLVVAVVPHQTLLWLCISNTEVKANGCQLINAILRKLIGTEISMLMSTPLSQLGASMRATMSLLFPKRNKLGVSIIPWCILSLG